MKNSTRCDQKVIGLMDSHCGRFFSEMSQAFIPRVRALKSCIHLHLPLPATIGRLFFFGLYSNSERDLTERLKLMEPAK